MEEQKPKGSVNPLVALLIIVSGAIAILTFLSNAINTPTVRQFDDAAKQAEIAACESAKGYKNTEDCYK
ncbi:hypothetical protein NSTC745_06436 [Nostoc sp. DSM 114161]|jgi:hypothetical protein|uniref:hypothetical protein n=1 Tax=Nostoc sp. DSM 114161 TaxID=3440143 RepID=UPI004045FCA4